MAKALTATAVANAKPRPDIRVEIADRMTPGLRLVVQPTGVKSWAFRYEREGKRAKITLGAATGAGALTLAEARERAGTFRKDLSLGTDPSERLRLNREAAAAKARETEDLVENVVADFLKRHVDANLKSAKEVRRILEKEVVPKWKGRRIEDIAPKDVIRLIDGIADRGAPIAANRTLANVKKFFSWCASRDLVQVSPAAKIKPQAIEAARDRVLTDVELTHVLAALARMPWPWRSLFTISLLTGQRRDEVVSVLWDELHLDEKPPFWKLPSGRTKNKREHIVPLPPMVVDIFKAAPEIEGCPYVFSMTGTTAVSGLSKAKTTLDKLIGEVRSEIEGETLPDMPDWRIHDFRRTFASGLARLGVQIAVVEKLLNHVSGSFGGIVGVYQHHDFADEKRRAAAAWAEHVQKLMLDAEQLAPKAAS